jgi:hypothetical protein
MVLSLTGHRHQDSIYYRRKLSVGITVLVNFKIVASSLILLSIESVYYRMQEEKYYVDNFISVMGSNTYHD